MEGWVLIHRKICDHPFYKERRVFSRSEAWFDLIILANHKDHKFLLGTEVVKAKRGEVISSEVKLSERWRWSRTKVRDFLALLEREQMVIKKATNKKTSLLLVNYEPYQKPETANHTAKKHQKNIKKTQSNNDKELGKNEKETPPVVPLLGDGDGYHVFDGWDLEDKASFLADTWNRFCGSEEIGLSKIALTPERMTTIQKKLVAFPDLMFEWSSIVGRVALDPFFHGNNPQGWRADFDWILSGDNYLALLSSKTDLESLCFGGESLRQHLEPPEPTESQEDTLGESLSGNASEVEELLPRNQLADGDSDEKALPPGDDEDINF